MQNSTSSAFRLDCFTYENHACLTIYNVRPGETFEEAIMRVFRLRYDFLETCGILHVTDLVLKDEPWGIRINVYYGDSDVKLPHISINRFWFSARFWYGDSGPTIDRPEAAKWGDGEERLFKPSQEYHMDRVNELGWKEARKLQMDALRI